MPSALGSVVQVVEGIQEAPDGIQNPSTFLQILQSKMQEVSSVLQGIHV